MGTKLSTVDRLRVAALALCCEKSVDRVYRQQASRRTVERVKRAALELGLPPPPQPEQQAA